MVNGKITFEGETPGNVSYENTPNDKFAREQINVLKNTVQQIEQVAEQRVRTVNGVEPIDGNITIDPGNVDTSTLATKEEVRDVASQLTTTVKKVNGVAPGIDGNVSIQIPGVDVFAEQLAETGEGLNSLVEQIDEAKGNYGSLKERLDNTGGGSDGNIRIIDLPSNSEVSLDTVDAPANTNSVFVKSSTRTTLEISWDLVPSRAVSHKVYVDGVYHSTHSYIDRKAEISSLKAYTDYSIKVTSIDENGNESEGKTEICKTLGYALKMNGKAYLKTASIQFDRLVLEFMLDKENGIASGSLMDGRTALGNSHIIFSGLTETWGSYFETKILDGITLTNSTGPFITSLKPSILDLKKNGTPVSAPINIFSHYSGNSNAKGELYRVQLFYRDVLVADYNFRKGVYTDQTGKGNELTITGGEFI